jgi:hypothetical protein
MKEAITVIIEFVRALNMCSVLISKTTSKIIRRIFNSPFNQVQYMDKDLRFRLCNV